MGRRDDCGLASRHLRDNESVIEDTRAEAREQHEQDAAFIRHGFVTRADLERSMSGYDAGVPFALLYRREAMQEAAQAELGRLAEIQDRAKWIEGIRRRLRLVAEVHRCWVWGHPNGGWDWWCQRDDCNSGPDTRVPVWADAVAEAIAHARSFVPQPPDETPVTGLDLMVMWIRVDQVRAEQDAFAAALPGRMAAVAEEINSEFGGWLPEGVRFEWK